MALSVDVENEAPTDLQTVARLTDPAFYASEPHKVYARLRTEAPVFRYQEGDIWGVSKFDDAKQVLGHPEVFSSMYGVRCTESMPADDGALLPDSEMPRRAELRRRSFYQFLGAGEELIVATDPPRHTRLRRLVSSAFTPRFIAKLEEGVRASAKEMIDRIEPDVESDFVELVARPLPLDVITQLLGVPREQSEPFGRWSDALSDASAHMDDDSVAWMDVLFEFAAYFGEQIEQRRLEPRDDLLTAIQAEIDGDSLSDMDLVMFAALLLTAGNETTQILISGGAKLLAEHPDQRAILVRDPAVIQNGIEEMLRCVTPVPAFCRTVKEPTTLRGQALEKGAYVVVMFASANRDEEFWSDPDRFDVTRKPDQGVAFGFGPHYCLGAALARLEARVVFEELLRKYPNFELAGESFRAPTSILPRYEHMPIVFHRP